MVFYSFMVFLVNNRFVTLGFHLQSITCGAHFLDSYRKNIGHVISHFGIITYHICIYLYPSLWSANSHLMSTQVIYLWIEWGPLTSCFQD